MAELPFESGLAENTAPKSRRPRLPTLLLGGFVLLVLNSLYLSISASASFFYLANVALHLALGAVLGVATLVLGGGYYVRTIKTVQGAKGMFLSATAVLGSVAFITGMLLTVTGATRPMSWLLYTHIGSCLGAIAALGLYLRARYEDRRNGRTAEGDWWRRTRTFWEWAPFLLPMFIFLGISQSRASGTITNPPFAPASMQEETPDPRLHPSSMQLKGTDWMPNEFFTETASKSCGEVGCHKDIYEQWYGSAHHNSSFNNQWYRKSIEYMQEVQLADAKKKGKPMSEGLRASQWCAGCHDPSILLTGRWQNDSIVNQLKAAKLAMEKDPKQWERLHSGLGCLTCHAAVHVNGTMGQAGLTLEYPELHKYAENPNPLVKKLHNYLTILDPKPHRALFLKSLHTASTAQFCSSCHKVHLDVPVNNYRWQRGFNDYDPWQMSGVSGEGARSFYYPEKFKKCADCHMKLVKSNDRGNINGMVHNHRFVAANTAIPVANGDKTQLDATTQFLKDKVLTVDIFGLRRGGVVKVSQKGAVDNTPRAASLMGDEGGASGGVGLVLDNSKLSAPLGAVPAGLKRGESVGVDVVVRTRGMGHNFPGGTIDAFDVWVEFKAVDNQGHVLLWSGRAADDGKGPVDKGAHFYRALQVDEKGNPINKRNAWSARAVVYANVIPPGAADTVHYRLKVPANCGDQVTLTAKVNYRKFSHYYTQFSYTARRDTTKPQDHTLDYDNGHFSFDADTSDVSGKVPGVPDVPIVTLCETTQVLPVTSAPAPPPEQSTAKTTWERWNDYGIGLLRQRDFRGAAHAFRNVLTARPDYGDGHVHLGQTLLDDGQVAEARAELEKAVSMATKRTQQGKAYYHYGRALFQSGRLNDAIQYYQQCSQLFPRDREVSNALGQALFRKGDYAAAEVAYRRTLAVDPEDVPANFTLTRVYNGLRAQAENDKASLRKQNLSPTDRDTRLRDLDARIRQYTQNAARSQKLFERFRADEAAGQRTAIFKRLNKEDNNEAQAVHEHG